MTAGLVTSKGQSGCSHYVCQQWMSFPCPQKRDFEWQRLICGAYQCLSRCKVSMEAV